MTSQGVVQDRSYHPSARRFDFLQRQELQTALLFLAALLPIIIERTLIHIVMASMAAPLSKNRSFLCLTAAQFLRAAHDKFFKMVVSLLAIERATSDASSYLSLASALLV